MTDDQRNRFRALGVLDATATDLELQQELRALQGRSRMDLERLRPKLACDDATFNALVKAVEEATARNIAIAEFTDRLKTLGKNVLVVAKHASSLL